MSPGDVEPPARNHPYLMVIAYDVCVGAEDFVSRQELQPLPA